MSSWYKSQFYSTHLFVIQKKLDLLMLKALGYFPDLDKSTESTKYYYIFNFQRKLPNNVWAVPRDK